MADGIKISIDNLNAFKADLQKLMPAVQEKVSKFLNKHAQAIATKAKDNAMKFKDEGTLLGAISADSKLPLEKHIIANTPYAAFVEFGTGKFAAQYVSTLPNDWQTYAAQFKGQKGSGTFDDFVIFIKEWLQRKGINVFDRDDLATNIDIDTGVSGAKKKRRSKGEKEAKYDEVAYLIARSIMINGSRARPYLYPAYDEQIRILIKELPNLMK